MGYLSVMPATSQMCQQAWDTSQRQRCQRYMGYLSEAEVPELYGIPLRGASRFKEYLSDMLAGIRDTS